MGRWDVVNPLDGEAMTKENAKTLRELRKARRLTRNQLRSGNPARRADAQKAHVQIPGVIGELYAHDVRQRQGQDERVS